MMGQDQKKEVSGSLPIAIAGRVYVKVSDRSEPIKPGDLLTSSDEPGKCMKAVNRQLSAGAIVGKALSHARGGYVLILINLH